MSSLNISSINSGILVYRVVHSQCSLQHILSLVSKQGNFHLSVGRILSSSSDLIWNGRFCRVYFLKALILAGEILSTLQYLLGYTLHAEFVEWRVDLLQVRREQRFCTEKGSNLHFVAIFPPFCPLVPFHYPAAAAAPHFIPSLALR